MTPKVLLAGVVVIVSGAGLIQFMGPETTNPATDPARTLQARVSVPADTDAILQRACRDCHSHDTRWPWYSHVAPVSWFVIDHVNHGRRHFNYSDWATYDADDTARLLKNTCELARKGAIPAHPLGEGRRKVWRFRLSELAAALCSREVNYLRQSPAPKEIEHGAW